MTTLTAEHHRALPATLVVAGRTFHLRHARVVPARPSAILLVFGCDLDSETTRQVAGLVGYAHRTAVRSRGDLPEPTRPFANAVMLELDLGGSPRRRTPVAAVLAQFEQELSGLMRQGTPVRTSDRAGVGTAGTRLIDGLPDLGFVVYYDDVLPAG